jgi:hypothetical protein
MTFDQFEAHCNQLYYDREAVMSSKRPGYTGGSEDVLANFKRVAERTGLTPLQVWAVYFLKHIDAITSIVTKPHLPISEAPLGRFGDAMNYLELGWALYNEEAGKQGRATGAQEGGGGTPAQSLQEPYNPAPSTIDPRWLLSKLGDQQFVGSTLPGMQIGSGFPQRPVGGVEQRPVEQNQRVVGIPTPHDQNSGEDVIEFIDVTGSLDDLDDVSELMRYLRSLGNRQA